MPAPLSRPARFQKMQRGEQRCSVASRDLGDATADYSGREMHAALEVDIPRYASRIATTQENVDLLSSAEAVELGAS